MPRPTMPRAGMATARPSATAMKTAVLALISTPSLDGPASPRGPPPGSDRLPLDGPRHQSFENVALEYQGQDHRHQHGESPGGRQQSELGVEPAPQQRPRQR